MPVTIVLKVLIIGVFAGLAMLVAYCAFKEVAYRVRRQREAGACPIEAEMMSSP